MTQRLPRNRSVCHAKPRFEVATTPGGGSAARVPDRRAIRLPRRLAPRRRPSQDRARVTVEAILQAAAELFAIHGYARTNTNDIASRSGVSVGSLYQYFPNKDAILAALLDKHLAGVDEAVRAGFADLSDPHVPLGTAMRQLFDRLLGLHEADPALTRAVEEQVGQLARLPAEYREVELAYAVELERILASRPEVRLGNHALMAQILFQVAEAVSAWLAHRGAQGFDRDAALDEATLVVCRYLEVAPNAEV